MRVNLGGEGEVPGVWNQQGPWVLDSGWRSSRHGKTLVQLRREGHVFVISSNLRLPFASGSVEVVITNGVPVDITTHLGPGVQSSEISRILRSRGYWLHNRKKRFTKP